MGVAAFVEAAAIGSALVRVLRASPADRTRFAPADTATDAFLPAVVRALRRSSASSRLESLAMSARECRRELQGTSPYRKS